MRRYYFTKAEHALENIEKQRLKISFADEVNDIFELKPFDFNSRDIRKEWQKCINKHAKSQGFISFTKDWSNPIMWAHYAGNHTGVCYGFDVLSNDQVKIDYVSNLRSFDERAIDDPAINSGEAEYASKTKSVDWSYEKESRWYVSLDDTESKLKAKGGKLFFLPFSGALVLREVIIGAKSTITSASIRDVLPNPDNVKIVTARASFKSYAMVEQKNLKMQR